MQRLRRVRAFSARPGGVEATPRLLAEPWPRNPRAAIHGTTHGEGPLQFAWSAYRAEHPRCCQRNTRYSRYADFDDANNPDKALQTGRQRYRQWHPGWGAAR